ncbi:MAG: hypothetical protein Q3997_04405 [Propionibacteriaceae bacterium]|nr:hypothetical protein [Propionibacteriaceae bacterium]
MRLLESVNPAWLTPGWVPLALVLVVAAACVGLYLNMRKHLRVARSNDPARHAESPAGDED